MKFNIFTTILLVLGLNLNLKAVSGGGDGVNQGGTSGCHGDFVSSEFNQR